MRANRASIATLVSCFLACTLIAAVTTGCDDEDCCTQTMGTAATSLDGTYRCGELTCNSGEVCVAFRGGIDSGVPDPAYCETASPLCVFTDCSGDCAPCIQQVCEYASAFVTVSGRDVTCGYP